ncbi:MAG TPA: CoA-binding protein [Gemmatimonadales bacterium]|jgi:predicted CoA-binding protein
MNAADPGAILKSARTVLLVDWPNSGVPRALLSAGLAVYGSSPAGYSRAELTTKRPAEAEGVNIVPLDGGFLVFARLKEAPASVDIVSAFRPAGEMPGIVAAKVLPLRAKTLWLHPTIASPESAALARHHGFQIVEGVDIGAAAVALRTA